MADTNQVVYALLELVDAVDRRVAQVERLGERHIAREAAALRMEAVRRIEVLTTERRNRATREAESSQSTMTDDGGPLGNHE